jgi:hypothetical protein
MPRAEILSKQAIHTLTQLHAELAGKIETNRKSGDKLRSQMVQVEAVMKMLDPEVNLRIIAPKRRVIGNPWFKRGTLYRSALDVLRTAPGSLAAADMVRAMLAAKGASATRQQTAKLEAAVWAAMRKHEGRGIEAVGDGKPARWRLHTN